MECPRCRHVSREESPRFCSQCGQKLSPAAAVQDSENNDVFVVASSSEGKTEQGEERKEEESPGSSKELENPEESDASWTIQMSKKKKRRKRNQSTTSSEAASLSFTSSGLWSLDMPSSLGSQDSDLAQNQVQQGGLGSQPGQSRHTVTMPMENGCVHAEGSSIPLQGHSGTGTDSGIGGGTQRNPVPSNHTEAKGLSASKASADKDLPQEGHCGPAPSACKGPAKATDALQSASLPESKGQKSEHKEKGIVTAELAASEPIDATAEAANPEKAGREKGDNGQKQKPSPVSPAAAKHQHQEANLKGKLAETGRNTGEMGDTQPEDQKKAEGNRNYAVALKNQKEQSNQKAAATEAAVRTLSPEDGLTVYFHAIVSRHFSFNPDKHRVCVRGGEGLGKKSWTEDACEMNYTKDLRELGSLVEGSMVIPRQSLDKPIPYKYVIHRGGSSKDDVEYEFIYEESKKKGEHVNRSLLVDSARLGTGDWHQYDDIICMKPPGRIQKFFDSFTDGTRKELVRGKQNAAVVMLGRIFSVLQPWSVINLQSFMTQFVQFYSVVRVPMVHEGQARRPWSSLQYEEKEVRAHLWEHVKTLMAPFLEGKSGDSLPADCPVRNGLKLGLTVLFMVEAVDFVVPKNDLNALCYLLTPSTGSPDTLHRDLSPILSKPQKWRAYLVNLCCRCIAEGIDRWLGTLPVLHYCMQLSPPRRDSKSQPEDTWAGLEAISFAQFREKAPTK